MECLARTGKLATLDAQHVLDRIAAGEYVPAIAQEIGVSKQALAQALARYDRDSYLQARETAAEIRLDEAAMAIEKAEDVIDLARARERFRAVAWRAEREHPQRWGQRTQVTHEVGPDLGDLLRDANKRVAQRQHAALQSPDKASNALDGTAQRID